MYFTTYKTQQFLCSHSKVQSKIILKIIWRTTIDRVRVCPQVFLQQYSVCVLHVIDYEAFD